MRDVAFNSLICHDAHAACAKCARLYGDSKVIGPRLEVPGTAFGEQRLLL
jgi:hypothetical protein